MAKKKRNHQKTLGPKEFLEQSRKQKKSSALTNRPKKAKFVSKTYNTSLSEFLHTIYVRNEQIPLSQRMNDPTIAAFVRKEFSNYEEIANSFEDLGGVRKVIYYRNFFNKGDLVQRFTFPEHLSYRYDDNKIVTSDRSDIVYDFPDEWKITKSAYYTAHVIHTNNGSIPEKFKIYKWILPPDHERVVESLRKLKRYAIAARNRHIKRKQK